MRVEPYATGDQYNVPLVIIQGDKVHWPTFWGISMANVRENNK